MISARTPRLAFGICAVLALFRAVPALAALPCDLALDEAPQKRLLRTPWAWPEPPVILPLDLSAPLSLTEALSHQILPRADGLSVAGVGNDAFDPLLLPPGSHAPLWAESMVPRLENHRRIHGAIVARGLFDAQPRKELEIRLRRLRRNLLDQGAIAFTVPKDRLPVALAAVKDAALTLVRLADHALAPVAEAVVVAMRLPRAPAQRAFHAPRPGQSERSHYNHAARWDHIQATKRDAAEDRDYFRREDGLNVSAEMRRRYNRGLAENAVPLEVRTIGGMPQVTMEPYGAQATYRPDLNTVLIHSAKGIVPPGSRFIALGLHGAGSDRSNADSWRINVGTFLGMKGALIAPDFPGGSLAPDYVNGDHYIEFLHGIVQHLRQTYGLPIVLVGRSFGSTMARELLHKYPQDAELAILGSYSNVYTTALQTRLMQQQERDGLIEIYWPSLKGCDDICEELRRHYRRTDRRFKSRRADGQPYVFYIQGRQDRDGGPTVVADLREFMAEHDPEAELLELDCDHFVFNPNPSHDRTPGAYENVRRIVFPYMQDLINSLVLNDD